jgi:hypothetical protein
MKKSILFNAIIFCLLGFGTKSQLLANDGWSVERNSPTANAIFANALSCDAPDMLSTQNITQTTMGLV